MNFNDIFRAQGVNIPLEFNDIYSSQGLPPTSATGGALPNATPGSGVSPINPNQTNINPMTGRPYSYMDSMNDANGQLMYDPGQSSLFNLLNGRFRTQGDPAFGQIQPMQQGQSPFAQQLVNSNMASSQIQQPQYQPQYQQFPWSQQTQQVQNLPQGMNGFGGGFGGGMGGFRGFDYSNPMNYAGYSNWNQPRRQSGKGMG